MTEKSYQRLAGFHDFGPVELRQLEQLREEVLSRFRLAGFERVEPPLLEDSNVFLERSGDAMRQKAYIFDDPSGREVGLRLEYTISVGRLFLQSGKQGGEACRYSYFGPVFRHDPVSGGRRRQFHQAGVECFGGEKRLAADAEILALAWETLQARGIKPTIHMGDMELFHAFANSLNLPPTFRTRLIRSFPFPERFERMLQPQEEADGVFEDSEFLQALESLGSERTEVVMRKILALADINHIGSRSIEEIGRRFLDRAAEHSEGVSDEQLQAIRDFVGISGKTDDCLRRLRELAKGTGAKLDRELQNMEERLSLAESLGVSGSSIRLSAALRRSIAYYTGFVFDMTLKASADSERVCVGGRYDRLLGFLGGDEGLPAVGFAMGMEALMAQGTQKKGDAFVPVRVYVETDGDPKLAGRALRCLRNNGINSAFRLAGTARKSSKAAVLKVAGKDRLQLENPGTMKPASMTLKELEVWAKEQR